MRRIIAALVAVGALGLAACGSTTHTSTTVVQRTVENTTTVAQPPQPPTIVVTPPPVVVPVIPAEFPRQIGVDSDGYAYGFNANGVACNNNPSLYGSAQVTPGVWEPYCPF